MNEAGKKKCFTVKCEINLLKVIIDWLALVQESTVAPVVLDLNHCELIMNNKTLA